MKALLCLYSEKKDCLNYKSLQIHYLKYLK